jgi:hypothetical protein
VSEPSPSGSRRSRLTPGERSVTTAAEGMIVVAGVLLGLLGAFHIASRPLFLGGHWPVAVVVAVVGNLGLGLLAGWGLEGRTGPALAFVGWIIGVGVVMFGGSDDVVIGGAPGDWVPLGFLLAGALAGVVAVAGSIRFVLPLDRDEREPASSLRASGRR